MKILLLIAPLVLFVSCNSAQNEFNPKSIELNNKAIGKMKIEDYQAALDLFDEAIELDSSYYIAYNNKVNTLVQLKRYDDAIGTSILSLHQRSDLAEGHFFLGLLFENNDEVVKAKGSYKKAIQIYEARISQGKMVEANEINLAVAYKFIGEKEKANKIFNKYIHDEKYGDMVKLLYESKKEDYLKQILNIN